MCVYVDQVFLENVSLWQVGSLSELSRGEFFWDYGANKIYLSDDPSGRRLEVSAVAGPAIRGDVSNVTIRNLVVERFGTGVQSGAISAGSAWTIQGVESRLNHGAGVRVGPGTVLHNSYIHHNGELGIAGGQARCAAAEGLVVENNEIAYNNIAGYNWTWEAGGSKWTYTNGLVVRGNFVHHNYGSGLWTDVSNVDTLYEDNRVEDNYGPGIIHEISYSAVIRNNVVRRNGFEHPVQGNVWSAGIHIAMSRDVEVYGNIVEDNAGGIAAVQTPAGDECGYGRQEVANLYVHDNVIRQPSGIAAGVNVYLQTDQSYFETKNNRWEDNRYTLGEPMQTQFLWNNQVIDSELWLGFDHDMNGSFAELNE
jgi:parallel beta-helix repeat protein